jgi:environmental stress-induced protein Ves
MHRLIAPGHARPMPWKNGGGRTTEIAAEPPGSTLDGFAWRVSIADVERDGPFSAFPGVDRTIVLLEGRGMELSDAHGSVTLAVPYEPWTFSGDEPVACRLVGGAVRDFNLMTRRADARGEVAVVRDGAERVTGARHRLCWTAAGAVECLVPGHAPFALPTGHALWQDGTDAAAMMSVQPLSAGAVALVVKIDAADPLR